VNHILFFLLVSVLLFFPGCDSSTLLIEINQSPFELIEHAAIHMQDGTGMMVNADTVMPGPHLDPDSIEHRRIDVTLQPMGSGYGGYIHFGPDVTGNILVCVDATVSMSVTNRSVQGDKSLVIERIFTEQEIADSLKTALIKSAVIFEAQSGGNIIAFEPDDQQVIHVVIEEVVHEHDE